MYFFDFRFYPVGLFHSLWAWTDMIALQGWTMYANLLIDLFRFLAPFLRNAELTKPTQLLYKVREYDKNYR